MTTQRWFRIASATVGVLCVLAGLAMVFPASTRNFSGLPIIVGLLLLSSVITPGKVWGGKREDNSH
jgi:hypothetical protein